MKEEIRDMPDKQRIGILGAGTWGMALARMLANCDKEVTVWSALPQEVEQLSTTHTHPKLPGVDFPETIRYTTDIEEACTNQNIIMFAVPSIFVRSTAEKAKPYIKDNQIIVDVAKGIEADTFMTLTEVIEDVLDNDTLHLVALSGPTHAEEVARGLPTAIVSACKNLDAAKYVQKFFSSPFMRVYTNNDVKGIEICGALKNIIALAAGISGGLGYGDNARAALITRSLAEMERLGGRIGCTPHTFSGLTGMGDLIVTCTSEFSRNNQAGHLIGEGKTPAEAVKEVGMVVEGINALPAAVQLAETYKVDMPIVMTVNKIVNEGLNPKDAVNALLQRDLKSETPLPSINDVFEESVLRKTRKSGMKRVITYGTFDLLHYGHINLLRRAKELGDYLIVGLSTDEFNWNEKQKKCYFTYEQRKQLLESVRYVDLVIPECAWDQKRKDVHEYHVDTFVMGDDWKGQFDFLEEEGAEVVYLPRTPEISTTRIKKDLNK